MSALSLDELHTALATLPGWSVDDGKLHKVYSLPSYGQCVDLVTSIARTAEGMDHHLDLLLGYGAVEVTTHSHDVKGLTKRDIALATAIEALPRGDLDAGRFGIDLRPYVGMEPQKGLDSLPWKTIAGGVQFAKIARQGTTGLVAYRIPADAGEEAFVPHTHLGGEMYLVVEGTVVDEKGRHPAGSLVWMPPFSRHTPRGEGRTTIVVLWPAGVKA